MTIYDQFDPTSLFSGEGPYFHRPILVAEAAEPFEPGTLLGAAVQTAVGSLAAEAIDTPVGNGTVTPDAATPVLAGAIGGGYLVKFTGATAFSVYDPNGHLVGAGEPGTAFATQIKFEIAAGATAFAAGDSFLLTVATKYVVSKANAVDGSQIPSAILAQWTDATGGDVTSPAYFQGGFVIEKVIYDPSWTPASLRAAILANRIPLYLRTAGTLG